MSRSLRILALPAALLVTSSGLAAPKKPTETAKEAPAEPARKKSGAPSAPPPKKQEGPSGVRPKDGTCPQDLVLTPSGTLMRAGMGLNFAVSHLMREDRCLPKILASPDGNWTMLEFEQGKAGWVQAGSAPLSFGDAPPLPEGEALFDATLTETTLGHTTPSLLAPVVDVVKEGTALKVHAVSEDGLMYHVATDGKSLGWVLKGMVRRSGETEQRAAGSGAWAPPPLPVEERVPGSLDALAPPPPDAPAPDATLPPAEAAPDETAAAQPTEGAAPAPTEKAPAAKPAETKSGLAALRDHPVGRGFFVGVGLAGGYFYERFNSNSFNDPIGNYRLDVGTAGLALDVAWRSNFGLVLGARLQGVGFGLSDSVTGPLQIWETLDATRRSFGGGEPGAPSPEPQTPKGIFGNNNLPLPGTVQSLNLWAGWRVFSAQDMDLDLTLGYSSELVLFGKAEQLQGNAEVDAFSDLWYHALRPGVRLLYRPLGGKFGAVASEASIGAGFVVPMVLKVRSTCSPDQIMRCLPFEETYVQNRETGRYFRRGFARPPPFTGLDLKTGYLFEAPFFQVEAGVQGMLRYSAVFYTAQEGMAKRNRYYDRASNIDLLAGPYLTVRGGI